jgi:hypothetical protein
MAVKTYDPKNVIVTVQKIVNETAGEALTVTGFADGTGIKVSRKNDMYTMSTGMDGETSRVKSNDKSGEISLTLAQTSPSNDLFRDLSESDTIDSDLIAITISNLADMRKYATVTAWPRKHADIEFGKDVSNREWTFDCVDIDFGSTIAVAG